MDDLCPVKKHQLKKQRPRLGFLKLSKDAKTEEVNHIVYAQEKDEPLVDLDLSWEQFPNDDLLQAQADGVKARGNLNKDWVHNLFDKNPHLLKKKALSQLILSLFWIKRGKKKKRSLV